MTRRLLNLVIALSLVLCVASLALWVRSHFRLDVAGRTAMWRDGTHWYWRNWHLRSADGGVRLMSEGFLVSSPTFANQWTQKVGEGYWRVYQPGAMGPRQPFPGNLWFDFWGQRKGNNLVGPEVIHSDALNVRVPYWLPALLTAILPAAWLVQYRRQRRRAAGRLCPTCGYDLRATPGRCPECGAVPG